MSNLIEIQNQIDKLQKQAAEIKTREFAATVQDILARMQAFGITLKDLQVGKARTTKGKSKVSKVGKGASGKAIKKAKSASVVAAKYRGPNGETWSGRGLTPRWLATLIAQGKTKDDFAVQS